MLYASKAELYFIAAMMILIMVLSVGAVFIFFRQLKREKADKRKRDEKKNARE